MVPMQVSLFHCNPCPLRPCVWAGPNLGQAKANSQPSETKNGVDDDKDLGIYWACPLTILIFSNSCIIVFGTECLHRLFRQFQYLWGIVLTEGRKSAMCKEWDLSPNSSKTNHGIQTVKVPIQCSASPFHWFLVDTLLLRECVERNLFIEISGSVRTVFVPNPDGVVPLLYEHGLEGLLRLLLHFLF